jgi:hypothetical protein
LTVDLPLFHVLHTSPHLLLYIEVILDFPEGCVDREPFLKRIQMLPPGTPALREPARVDRLADLIYFFIREKDFSFALDVGRQKQAKEEYRSQGLRTSEVRR